MDCNFTLCKRYLNGNCIKQVGEKCQLEVAKKIIKNLKTLYFSPVVTKDDVKRQDEILNEAEQFLKEIE